MLLIHPQYGVNYNLTETAVLSQYLAMNTTATYVRGTKVCHGRQTGAQRTM